MSEWARAGNRAGFAACLNLGCFCETRVQRCDHTCGSAHAAVLRWAVHGAECALPPRCAALCAQTPAGCLAAAAGHRRWAFCLAQTQSLVVVRGRAAAA